MRKSDFSKIFAIALMSASMLYVPKAEAMIPVIDGTSIANTIKDWMNNIKETKLVTDTVAFANKTSAAIGDAKKSVSEYVIKNKEKAEEKLKKLNEYKKQAEEYKKEYDEYKKMLDENIEAAQKLKAEAEAKLAEAQEMKASVEGALSEAQATAGAVGDLAQSKISDAASKAGISSSGSGNSGVTFADPSIGGSSNVNVGALTSAGNSYSIGSSAAGSTDSASGYSAPVYADTPIATSRAAFGGTSGTASGAASGGSAAASVEPLTAEEKAALPAVQAKAAAGQTLTAEEQQLVAKAAKVERAEQKEKAAAIKQKLANGEQISDEERALLEKDYADEAAELKAIEEKQARGEELTEDEQALLDEKAEEDKAKEEKLSSMSEEELREKLAALDKAKLDSWSDEFLYTREELEANLKAKDEAKKASLTNEHAYTTEELEKNLKAKDEEKRSSLGIRSRTTSRDLKARTPQRRNFTRSGNRASLEIGEVQSFASLQNETPLAFAFALEIDDDGTDVNKSYLVPRTINKTCGLSSKKAKEKGAMDECLVGIFDKLKQPRAYNEAEFMKQYNQGRKEYAAALIAEGYKAQNDADGFEEKTLDVIDFSEADTTADHYAHLVEMNKAVTTTINGLLKIYSSRLALNTYSNYSAYDFSTPEECYGDLSGHIQENEQNDCDWTVILYQSMSGD